MDDARRVLHHSMSFYLGVITLGIAIYLYRSYPAEKRKVLPLTPVETEKPVAESIEDVQ